MTTTIKSRTVALCVGALTLFPAAALAQTWPSKPIRVIVPFPAGGGVDYIARLVGKGVSERLGQQVVVDNRAGASAIIGMELLKAAAPDGYTLVAASAGPLAINPHIFSKLPYDTLRDFTPVSNLTIFPYLLVTHASLPVKNVRELIALARARPGEIMYSSPGEGNGQHLATALFASMAKVKLVHVPYKGNAPSVIALLSGETQLTHSSIPAMLPHVRAGKVKALGIATAQRVPSLPEFPTVAEGGLPGFEASGWAGLLGPANMPADVVQRLNKAVADTLSQKDNVSRMLSDGALPSATGAQEFAAFLRSELKKWGAVVKVADVKAR
jgi:tripartite-type tricarboxylate transporter receptor subunit TctC